MATFVVEMYLSGHTPSEPDATIDRIVTATEELTASGADVRYLRSIFIPDDETCLFLFDAESEATVALTARRAGLDPARIAAAQAEDGKAESG